MSDNSSKICTTFGVLFSLIVLGVVVPGYHSSFGVIVGATEIPNLDLNSGVSWTDYQLEYRLDSPTSACATCFQLVDLPEYERVLRECIVNTTTSTSSSAVGLSNSNGETLLTQENLDTPPASWCVRELGVWPNFKSCAELNYANSVTLLCLYGFGTTSVLGLLWLAFSRSP